MTSDVQAARENAVLIAAQLDVEDQPLHASTVRIILSALTAAEERAATLERERDEARALAAERLEALRIAGAALNDAAEDVESWGAYAGEFFQEKHDLSGNVAAIRAAALLASARDAEGGANHG